MEMKTLTAKIMEKSIIDRLVEDKRIAQKQAKENFKKPEYQEALKRLRLRNEARGASVITTSSR
jgi:Skp family chaperone for outer membrane proteins